MKKLIAMLLVLTMVLSFAACAKQDTVTPPPRLKPRQATPLPLSPQ